MSKPAGKSIVATVANTDQEKIYLRLPSESADFCGSENWSTGITVENVYIGRKWFIVEFYSIWVDRRSDGRVVGTYYVAYDMTNKVDSSEILGICERLDIEVPSKISSEEA